METTPPLFQAPKPYTATVRLRHIAIPERASAKSRTRRSIAAFGQLTLPLLRELYPPDGWPEELPYFEIVDGHRRIVDLAAADASSVEAKVLPHSVDRVEAAAMAVALNFARAPNPLREAEHFDLLRRQGYDLEDIANMLGISRSKVDKRIRLLDGLAPELLAEVGAGRMAIGVAEQVSRLSREVQDRLVAKLQVGDRDRITADDVAEQLRVVRSGMLPQDRLFEVPRDDARRALVAQLRELRQQGLTRGEVAAAIDEVFADAG